MNILRKTRPSFSLIEVLVIGIAMTGGVARGAGQVRTDETVTQKLTEQYENSPLKASAWVRVYMSFPETEAT
jgi:hypothetical protein